MYSTCAKIILSLLIPILLLSFGIIDVILKEEFKGFSLPIRFLFAVYAVFLGCNYVQAHFPNICLHRYSYIFSSEVEHILEGYFQHYKALNYEDIPEIANHSILIQNRLNKIPDEINKIDETQKEIHIRYKNLYEREANFKVITNKINKRETNAGDKITIFEIPKIENKELILNFSYKRILMHGKQIKDNIEIPSCSLKCSFYLIDQSSLDIVHEIDSIKSKQDLVLAYVTSIEKEYNKLQDKQITIENSLSKRNF